MEHFWNILITAILIFISGLIIDYKANKKIKLLEKFNENLKKNSSELYATISKLNTSNNSKITEITLKDKRLIDLEQTLLTTQAKEDKLDYINNITKSLIKLVNLNIPNYLVAEDIYTTNREKSYIFTLQGGKIGANIKPMNTTKDKSIPKLNIDVSELLIEKFRTEILDYDLITLINTLDKLDIDVLSSINIILYHKLEDYIPTYSNDIL